MDELNDWKIFQGNREPHAGIKHLPPPPKWRRFNYQNQFIINKSEIATKWKQFQKKISINQKDKERGETFRIQAHQITNQTNDGDNNLYNNVIDAINAALYLRRPLLVTGKPGSGKTSLAYAVAYELMLGSVLVWAITARSTLQEGLYRYDAIARLQDVQLADKNQDNQQTNQQTNNNQNIGEYIQLGAVGTAFLPSPFPRVLLIDEIDKSDINLPNDLLNLFEEGEFEIPELVRLSKHLGEQEVKVGTKDGSEVGIKAGRVLCDAFPFVIMTSNGERDFPPAFLRRCLRVNMPQPQEEVLKEIVKSQLDLTEISEQSQEFKLIQDFVSSLDEGDNLAIDQLLNIVYMVTNENVKRSEIDIEKMKNLLLKALNSAEDI